MTTIAHYKYEIDADNAIRVWDLNNPNDDVPGNPPFMYQPHSDKSTEPFESAEAAKEWIENVINNEWLATKTPTE